MDKGTDIYVTQKLDVRKQEKIERYLFMNIVHDTVDPPCACVLACCWAGGS